MTAVRTYLAAISVALLMPPCAAQAAGLQDGVVPQRTQPPAPIVRRPPTETSPVTTPKYMDGPAPLAVHRTQPATTQTSPGASGSAPVKTVPLAGAPTASAPKSITKADTPPKPAHPATAATPKPTGPLASSSSGPFNRTSVFIDPAHGGVDVGSRITDSILEKDVTLQLAFKLRSLLTARGFTVQLSREDETAAPPSPTDTVLSMDTRAGMANHARPVACLLLHATASGRGVHLYSSEIAPTEGEVNGAPWLTAQAPWVSQSVKLEKQIGQALARAEIPLVLSRASVRPVDSLTCPALVVELAPAGNDVSSIGNGDYQQRVASAIASALVFWQNAAQPPVRLVPLPPPPAAPASTSPTTTTGGVQP